ncbi:MAG: right-handed parallel beta-helix repeat-containing protein [Armatimonadetes bacterium]|nr:right-handed parallel beta-helix repeat-containing protein [Armatimonadota bacterium]
MLDICDFGAVGDGKTDCTEAIQKAIDRAEADKGTVVAPEGVFLVSTIRLRPQVGLMGYPTWSYRSSGGSVLKLADPSAKCLIDLTGAFGAKVQGLCLDGGGLGEGVHGILVDKPDYGQQEDTPLIDGCQVGWFSGDGIRLWRIWCFSLRHCMICYNHGEGVRVRGWDGFILDNWFSGNRRAGFGAYEENASITMTGNRIEWNGRGGIVIHGGSHYNLTGNYIDRSGGPAIALLSGPGDDRCHTFTVTGNVLYRSGAPNWRRLDENEDCHLLLDGASNTVVSGNSLRAGRDDGGKGEWSPAKAIVFRNLRHCILKDNVMEKAATRELLIDLGGHGEGVVMKDNVGSVIDPAEG